MRAPAGFSVEEGPALSMCAQVGEEQQALAAMQGWVVTQAGGRENTTGPPHTFRSSLAGGNREMLPDFIRFDSFKRWPGSLQECHRK